MRHCLILFALISVDQQPIFTSQPYDIGPMLVDTRGIMQCSASGTPPITYRWLKNAQYMTNASTHGVLLLSKIDKSDVATYQCVATNRLGSVLSNKAQLTIACESTHVGHL